MHIDSVRELKAELIRKHLMPLAASPAKISALGIAARAVADLDAIPRTIALGISAKGRQDFQLAVRVQNRALMRSATLDAIVKGAKGESEVQYIGRLVKRAPWNQIRQRPLLIGISIGHYKITAGTLGCFAQMRSDGSARILSNNHVLANENQAKKGDAIIQPGQFDGGKKDTDTVAALDRFVRLLTDKPNSVDCALATPRKTIAFDARTLTGLGNLAGTRPNPLDAGEAVAKVGRTTDVTRGRVTAIELDNVVVSYDIGNLRFDNQVEIEGAEQGPFSQGGDSGSLIVDANFQAAALLFAGGDQGGSNGQGLTFANPIQAVFDALRVDLLT